MKHRKRNTGFKNTDGIIFRYHKKIFDKFLTEICNFHNSGSVMLNIISGLNLLIGEIYTTCNWTERNEWEIGYKLPKEFNICNASNVIWQKINSNIFLSFHYYVFKRRENHIPPSITFLCQYYYLIELYF